MAEYRAAFFLTVKANGEECCEAPKTTKHSIKVSYTKKKVGIGTVFNQKLVVNCTINYKEMVEKLKYFLRKCRVTLVLRLVFLNILKVLILIFSVFILIWVKAVVLLVVFICLMLHYKIF